MNYESVLLELLSRVQKLEADMKVLKESGVVRETSLEKEKKLKSAAEKSMSENVREAPPIGTEQVCDHIQEKKEVARLSGEETLELRAGDLARELGISNRLQIVLNAMQKMMGAEDVSEGSATMYTVRYALKQRQEVKSMKGTVNNFVIKKGISPQSESGIREMKVYEGQKYLLAYDASVRCVGVVFKHNESRRVAANGQAEICFFDRYYNELGRWHRMFYGGYQGGERILYDDLEREVECKGSVSYSGYIRP